MCFTCQTIIKKTIDEQNSKLLLDKLVRVKRMGLNLLKKKVTNEVKVSCDPYHYVGLFYKVALIFLASSIIISTTCSIDLSHTFLIEHFPGAVLPYVVLAKDITVIVCNTCSYLFDAVFSNYLPSVIGRDSLKRLRKIFSFLSCSEKDVQVFSVSGAMLESGRYLIAGDKQLLKLATILLWWLLAWSPMDLVRVSTSTS